MRKRELEREGEGQREENVVEVGEGGEDNLKEEVLNDRTRLDREREEAAKDEEGSVSKLNCWRPSSKSSSRLKRLDEEIESDSGKLELKAVSKLDLPLSLSI